MRLGLFAIALLVLLSEKAPASTFSVPEADQDRLLYMYGPIGGRSALETASRVEKLSEDATRPIYIVINSPGGEVLTGLQIVSSMQLAKSRGVEIRCMVGMLAASMASIIYDECTERSAFRESLLLWHSIAMDIGGGFMSPGVRLTPDLAKSLAFSMDMLQQDIPARLQQHLGFDDETWHYLFDGQAFIPAGWLHSKYNPHYLRIVDDVDGISSILSMKPPQSSGSPVAPDDKSKKPGSDTKQQQQHTEAEPVFPAGPQWIPSDMNLEQMDEHDAQELAAYLQRGSK